MVMTDIDLLASRLHPNPPLQGGKGWGRGHGRRTGVVWLLLCLAAPGCAFVPKSRLDDAAKVTQSLRSENAQLKDTALSLKGENSDLTRRALDDTRKIATLEDANTRLETNVQAYIDERDDLNDSFQRFKRQAQAAIAPSPSVDPVR